MIEVKECSKGHGVFATKNIPKDTIIIREKPVIYPNKSKIELTDLEQMIKLMHHLLHSTSKKKESFLQLVPLVEDEYIVNYSNIQKYHHQYFPELDSKTYCLYYSKMYRNAFYFYEDTAILFDATIMNHSCNPNVNYYPKQDLMFFKTIRPIKKDEELEICYINKDTVKHMSTIERQTYLLHHYGFHCTCNTCNTCTKCKIG